MTKRQYCAFLHNSMFERCQSVTRTMRCAAYPNLQLFMRTNYVCRLYARIPWRVCGLEYCIWVSPLKRHRAFILRSNVRKILAEARMRQYALLEHILYNKFELKSKLAHGCAVVVAATAVGFQSITLDAAAAPPHRCLRQSHVKFTDTTIARRRWCEDGGWLDAAAKHKTKKKLLHTLHA